MGGLLKLWQKNILIFSAFGNKVYTNLETMMILLATGMLGGSLFESCWIVFFMSACTGLHLASHWMVSVLYGKGIHQMILTRAG